MRANPRLVTQVRALRVAVSQSCVWLYIRDVYNLLVLRLLNHVQLLYTVLSDRYKLAIRVAIIKGYSF